MGRLGGSYEIDEKGQKIKLEHTKAAPHVSDKTTRLEEEAVAASQAPAAKKK